VDAVALLGEEERRRPQSVLRRRGEAASPSAATGSATSGSLVCRPKRGMVYKVSQDSDLSPKPVWFLDGRRLRSSKGNVGAGMGSWNLSVVS
jgi:hypothetical protein